MKINIIKIIILVAPLIKDLLDRRVPKSKTNIYSNAAKSNDTVMDSLQDLAVKVRSGLCSDGSLTINDPNKELDKQNLDTGIELVEVMIKAYRDRLEAIKLIRGN